MGGADIGSILVVDDDRTFRQMLAHRLRVAGFRVVTAEEGQQALELLIRDRFDAVLLDIVMPQPDGIEVLGRIKKTPGLTDLPVIMMSTLDEMDAVVECLEAGAADFLPKPLDSLLLVARVNGLLHQKQVRAIAENYQRAADELAAAAASIADGTSDARMLDDWTDRRDSFGRLATEFQRLARLIDGGDDDGPSLPVPM